MKKVSTLLIWVFCSCAYAGIAQQYPYDKGIQNDPDVLFAEFFEVDKPFTLFPGWSSAKYEGSMSFSPDKPAKAGGALSLMMSNSANLFRRFPAGEESVYVRFYVKYSSSCQAVDHAIEIGGANPPVSALGGWAGVYPTGLDHFITNADPIARTWNWGFYTYWCEMVPGWGNNFRAANTGIPRDQWICVEVRVKMNNPVTARNGEQTLWIDGVQKIHMGQGFPGFNQNGGDFYVDPSGTPFKGFMWRKTTDLNLNFICLQHYLEEMPACPAWFDNVVIARKYIGPIEGTGTPPSDIAPPRIGSTFPNPGARGVSPAANINFQLKDFGSGIDSSTIVLKVKGQVVKPTITGTPTSYSVSYNPAVDFPSGDSVYVSIDAKDRFSVPNVMKTEKYYFIVSGTPGVQPANRISAPQGLRIVQSKIAKNSVFIQVSTDQEGETEIGLIDPMGKKLGSVSQYLFSGTNDLSFALPKAKGLFLAVFRQGDYSITKRICALE